MNETVTRGRIVVRGSNIMQPPLLESTEPCIVEVYDAFGEPMALLVRILADDTWGLCTKGDPDWSAMLVRHGLARLAPGTSVQELIKSGMDSCVESKT